MRLLTVLWGASLLACSATETISETQSEQPETQSEPALAPVDVGLGGPPVSEAELAEFMRKTGGTPGQYYADRDPRPNWTVVAAEVVQASSESTDLPAIAENAGRQVRACATRAADADLRRIEARVALSFENGHVREVKQVELSSEGSDAAVSKCLQRHLVRLRAAAETRHVVCRVVVEREEGLPGGQDQE